MTRQEAERLALRQFNYLDRQIRLAVSKINGLVPEYDDRMELERFIDACIRQRAELAGMYGFRL